MKNKDETAARIERNAIDYVFTETGYQVLPEHYNWKEAYIAGATAERTRADQELAACREENKKLREALKGVMSIIENSNELWITESQWQLIDKANALM